MKNCPMCGIDHSDGIATCSCGYAFAHGDAGSDSSDTIKLMRDERPTGETPMMIGYASLVGAVVCVLLSFANQPESWETGPYASATGLASAAEKLANAFLFQLAGGGLFSLFLALWCVGYVVRAISFLPGKGD